MKERLRRFFAENGGFTATEYAVVAFLVSILIAAGAKAIGAKLSINYLGAVAANL
ncbi:MAG: Flp family type IVb pilin [Hyphomicrobiales bacterium]|nr:MAG: Flp family type IVb pilin [Hyphomicrobiales bacterium]